VATAEGCGASAKPAREVWQSVDFGRTSDAERQQCCNNRNYHWTSRRSSQASSQLFHDQAIFTALAAGPPGPPAQELMVERRPFASIFVKKQVTMSRASGTPRLIAAQGARTAAAAALSHCQIEHVTNLLALQFHVATTTSRHVCRADAPQFWQFRHEIFNINRFSDVLSCGFGRCGKSSLR
jgi:hypothetical protein